MKERSPLCRHCVQERHVCLHTGSQGVLFRAPEPAQDPSSQADDVLRWVGPAGRGGGGGGGTRHSPALGPRCFLSACWKSTNAPVMGQINREPCAAAAPAMPCGTSKRALNIQLLFSLALFFYFFRLPRSLPFSWTLVIKQINLSSTSAERV